MCDVDLGCEFEGDPTADILIGFVCVEYQSALLVSLVLLHEKLSLVGGTDHIARPLTPGSAVDYIRIQS